MLLIVVVSAVRRAVTRRRKEKAIAKWDATPDRTVGSSGTEKDFVSLLTDGLLMSVPFPPPFPPS